MNHIDTDVDAPLRAELQSDLHLPAARRALYGVMPAGLNEDEQAVARLLDDSPLVRWWHRNASDYRYPDALGLYRWDDGDGFARASSEVDALEPT